MSYEAGPLDAALGAVVGDDPLLIHDLRRAFLEIADRQIDLAARAKDEASWKQALWRLRGLSGSFGILPMIVLNEEAERLPPGDAKMLRRLRATLDALKAG